MVGVTNSNGSVVGEGEGVGLASMVISNCRGVGVAVAATKMISGSSDSESGRNTHATSIKLIHRLRPIRIEDNRLGGVIKGRLKLGIKGWLL